MFVKHFGLNLFSFVCSDQLWGQRGSIWKKPAAFVVYL